MSIFLWSSSLPLRPSHLWVRKRSRKHRIDEGVGAGCRSSGVLGLGRDPHKAPWAGWWGTGPSHQPTSQHCTSSDLPSRTGGAVQRWPVLRPAPHRPAGLPRNVTCNGHVDAGRGTPPLGVGILLNKVLWLLSVLFLQLQVLTLSLIRGIIYWFSISASTITTYLTEIIIFEFRCALRR